MCAQEGAVPGLPYTVFVQVGVVTEEWVWSKTVTKRMGVIRVVGVLKRRNSHASCGVWRL